MLVAVITGPTLSNIESQIRKAAVYAEVLEFRFDLFDPIGISLLASLKNTLSLPLIFTYRPKPGLLEKKRIEILKSLLELMPEYVDLEEDLPVEVFSYFSKRTKVICSYHNFESAPDLEKLYVQMKKKKAHVYKIATFATSSLDALTMLLFILKHKNISGMCMGEHGQLTRILGPVVGSFFTYGCIQGPVAPGQLSLKTLCTTYRHKELNRKTKVYALLGDPVSKSIGHYFHNQIFSFKNANKIYVKIRVKKEELRSFFSKIPSLPFYGFSVTMPLKELIIPLLDTITPVAKKMGSVNTLVKTGGWHGLNTDGAGAAKAIEKHIALLGKRVLVIGAGGAAKALVVSLLERGANVVLINRTVEKAKLIAQKFSIKWDGLTSLRKILEEGVDLIVNTASDTTCFSKSLSFCRSKPVVMDMVYNPTLTDFLSQAKKLGFPIIFGYEMFIYQAVLQQKALFSEALARV
jgi:3-dehydroquinate dehydratase/shikimate dehydrogenase